MAVDDLLASILLPLFTVVVLKEAVLFLQAFLSICSTSSPEVQQNEENPNRVAVAVKFLAAFIGLVYMGVSSVFIFHLHDASKYDKYVCPKARFLGPKDPNPYANHTVDFYMCEEQRRLLKSTWSNILVLGPTAVTTLGTISLTITYITSPKAIKIMKHCYIIILLYYTGFVYKFQENFESTSDIMAYIRSAFIIFVFVIILYFISANSETEAQLNQTMFIVMIIVGHVLAFHVGYNGFHLVCGNGNILLPVYLVTHGLIVFSLSMFHEEMFPHVALFMSLFIIPPVCPVVIALTAWSLDALWKDIAAMGRDPEVPTEPATYGIPVVENYFHVEEYRNLRSRRRNRRANPVRGIF